MKLATKAILTILAIAPTPLLLAAPPKPRPPVVISAEVGFANHLPADRPFPVFVELREAMKEIDGHLRVLAPNAVGGETVYAAPVSLSPNARKRWGFTLPAIAGNAVKVQIVDRNGALVHEDTFFGLAADRTPLVVLVQDDALTRFNLPRAPGETTRAWRTASVTPDQLPANPLAYTGVAAVVWRVERESAIEFPQAEALLDWLEQGGLLVVAGGRTTPPNLPRGFRYPARWGEIESFDLRKFSEAKLLSPRRSSLRTPQVFAADGSQNFIPANIAIRPLLGDDVHARMSVSGTRLATEEIVHGGALLQLAFDPYDLAELDSSLGREWWETALALAGPQQPDWVALDWLRAVANDRNHLALAQAAEYRVESVWKIAWMFGGFFGLAFCLNFWLFRKSRRYEIAWLILIVASVSMFLYNRAFGRVGGFGPTRQIELTRSYGVAGARTVLNFTESGLLAPSVRNVSLATTSPQQLLLSVDGDERTVLAEESRQVYPVRLKAGAFTTCSSLGMSELPGDGLTVSVSQTGNILRVAVANRTGLRLGNPRFTPTVGTHRVEAGERYVLSVPIGVYESWRRTQQSQANDANWQFGYVQPDIGRFVRTRRRGWFGSSRSTYPASIYIPQYRSYPYSQVEPENPQASPLAFRFDLPETAAPVTASGARAARCKRSVTLFIPLPVTMDETRPTVRPIRMPPTVSTNLSVRIIPGNVERNGFAQ